MDAKLYYWLGVKPGSKSCSRHCVIRKIKQLSEKENTTAVAHNYHMYVVCEV